MGAIGNLVIIFKTTIIVVISVFRQIDDCDAFVRKSILTLSTLLDGDIDDAIRDAAATSPTVASFVSLANSDASRAIGHPIRSSLRESRQTLDVAVATPWAFKARLNLAVLIATLPILIVMMMVVVFWLCYPPSADDNIRSQASSPVFFWRLRVTHWMLAFVLSNGLWALLCTWCFVRYIVNRGMVSMQNAVNDQLIINVKRNLPGGLEKFQNFIDTPAGAASYRGPPIEVARNYFQRSFGAC